MLVRVLVWFGFCFVVGHTIVLESRESENNPSLVVAAETRETDEEQKETRSLVTEMNAF